MNARQARREAERKAEKERRKELQLQQENYRWKRDLQKNGITVDVLEDRVNAAYQKGIEEGILRSYIGIYSCILLAAHRKFRFGTVRGIRLLQEVDDTVTSLIGVDDAERMLKEEMGLKLVFDGTMMIGVDREEEKK